MAVEWLFLILEVNVLSWAEGLTDQIKGLTDFFEATDDLTEVYANFVEALSKLTEAVNKITEAFSIWMIKIDSTVWDINNSNKLNLLNKAL